MFYGYGLLSNHTPTLRATTMRGGSSSSLLTGLYAVYKAESNATDSLGTYGGSAQGGLTYIAGKSGNEFVFNGTNSAVLLPTDSFKLTANFTISFWYYPTSISGNYCVFINDVYSAPNEKGFRVMQKNATLELKIFNNTTTITLVTGNVFTANTRYLCTVIHSATGNEIRINGASSVTDSSTTNAIFATGTTPWIGVNAGVGITANSYSNARIDELLIYNRALTSLEDITLYNSGAGKFYPTF
jgi:hypothetical protein